MGGMVSVEIDKAGKQQLAEALNALYMLSDKPLEQVMREQGRLFAVDLSTWTHVVGSKPVIGKMQKAAIERSILRTYKSANKVIGAVAKKGGRKAAERFAKFIKSNDVAKAQNMVDTMNIRVPDSPWNNRPIKIMRFDGGQIHYNRRKSKTTAPPSINYVVTDYRRVALPSGKGKTFVNQEKRKAGQLKAGWSEAANDLGKGMSNPSSGIPAFANAKNHKTKGSGRVKGDKDTKIVTVANMANYAEASTVDHKKALALRKENIDKVITRMLTRNARAITRSQRKSARNAKKAAQFIKLALK